MYTQHTQKGSCENFLKTDTCIQEWKVSRESHQLFKVSLEKVDLKAGLETIKGGTCVNGGKAERPIALITF